jgi:hypothetical protein
MHRTLKAPIWQDCGERRSPGRTFPAVLARKTRSDSLEHCFFSPNIVFSAQTLFEAKKQCVGHFKQCFFPKNNV